MSPPYVRTEVKETFEAIILLTVKSWLSCTQGFKPLLMYNSIIFVLHFIIISYLAYRGWFPVATDHASLPTFHWCTPPRWGLGGWTSVGVVWPTPCVSQSTALLLHLYEGIPIPVHKCNTGSSLWGSRNRWVGEGRIPYLYKMLHAWLLHCDMQRSISCGMFVEGINKPLNVSQMLYT